MAKKYFAHNNLIHDGRIIARGEPLPEGLAADSLAVLIRQKAVGEAPPAETVITRTPGTPSAPAATESATDGKS